MFPDFAPIFKKGTIFKLIVSSPESMWNPVSFGAVTGRGPCTQKPDEEVRPPPWWPPSPKNCKVVFWDQFLAHPVLLGGGRSTAPVVPACSGRPGRHLALLEVTGRQLKTLAPRAWNVATCSLLQPHIVFPLA